MAQLEVMDHGLQSAGRSADIQKEIIVADKFPDLGVGNINPSAQRFAITDEAFATGLTTFRADLVKYEDNLLQPLRTTTYTRDMPIRVSAFDDWSEWIEFVGWDYNVSGGMFDNLVAATAQDNIPVAQVEKNYGRARALLFEIATKIRYIELQKLRQSRNRDYENLLTIAVREIYDAFLNQNAYLGMTRYGTTGLLNDPNITAMDAPAGTSGGTTWATKTSEERIADMNLAIETVWQASGLTTAVTPTRILLPPSRYTLLTNAVQQYAGGLTIFQWFLQNNLTSNLEPGSSIQIYPVPQLENAGEDDSARMVIYRFDENLLRMEELAPLRAAMIEPNIQHFSYDTIYAANISEVMILYPQTVLYMDGI